MRLILDFKKTFFSNSRGFSLIELMISTAIGVFLSLGIATVFIFSVTQFQFMMDKTQAEENALLLSFYTRTFLSQAIDLRPTRAISNGTGALDGGGFTTGGSSTRGYFDYNFDAIRHFQGTAGTGQSAPIAIFNREWGFNDPDQFTRATGIFFTDRDRDSNVTLERSVTVAFVPTDTANQVIYDDSAIRFERVSRFEVQKIARVAGGTVVDTDPNTYCLAIDLEPAPEFAGLPAGCVPDVGAGDFNAANLFWRGLPHNADNERKIKSITFSISTRHFRSLDRNSWNYGPASEVITVPYRDIEMTVQVNIKNNVLSNVPLIGGVNTEERVYGGLYFFRPVFPRFQ